MKAIGHFGDWKVVNTKQKEYDCLVWYRNPSVTGGEALLHTVTFQRMPHPNLGLVSCPVCVQKNNLATRLT